MEQLARVFLILEMLFVNLLTSHMCSKRRYSIIRIIGELTLFTILIFIVSFLIRFSLNLKYLNGSILILLGLTYFFPLKHLYHRSFNKTLAIMFFSWIHTMTVTYFSMQISTSFGFDNKFQAALIVQTIIYLFTTPFVIKFVKNRFLYILRNIPSEMNKYLIILSLVELSTLAIIYLYVIEGSNHFWKVITVILVVLTAFISYHLIYIIVKNVKNINFLKQLAYTDNLTGIKNRLSLFLDCEELISRNKPFTIIYMDLDNFKKVNDTYGHSVGDDYLKQFTKATIETVGHRGSIYRMSGDEFVCLYKETKIYLFLATFNEKISNLFDMNIPFLGVSIGYAKFPEDADSLDKLIKKADTIMYKVKKN